MIGILLGNMARFMSKEMIMLAIVAVFALLVAHNFLGKRKGAPAADRVEK